MKNNKLEKFAEEFCSYCYHKGICWVALVINYDPDEHCKKPWFNKTGVRLTKAICRYLHKRESCVLCYYPCVYKMDNGEEVFSGSCKDYVKYLESNHLVDKHIQFNPTKGLFFDKRDYEDNYTTGRSQKLMKALDDFMDLLVEILCQYIHNRAEKCIVNNEEKSKQLHAAKEKEKPTFEGTREEYGAYLIEHNLTERDVYFIEIDNELTFD